MMTMDNNTEPNKTVARSFAIINNSNNNVNSNHSRDQSALDSVSLNARAASSVLGNLGSSCAWPHGPGLLQGASTRRSTSLALGGGDMDFRRDSLGLGFGAGELSFPSSRRSSLAFGLDFNSLPDHHPQQHLQQQVHNDLSSSLTPDALLNARLLGSGLNPQPFLSSNSGRGNLSAQEQLQLLQLQQQQMQIQQQQQQHEAQQQHKNVHAQLQQQAMSAMDPSSEARRIQAEAQAAAAALFLGAPLPGNDDSPTNGLGLGGINEQIASRRGSLAFFNNASSSFGGGGGFFGGPLAAPNALPTSQIMQGSMNNINGNGHANFHSSLSIHNSEVQYQDNNNSSQEEQAFNSYSQLQQLQLQEQQQRLQRLQALGNSQVLQPSSQQQGILQEQRQLQQLLLTQQQQQLMRQQRDLRRHSLALGFPFDTLGSPQQPQQQQTQQQQTQQQSQQLNQGGGLSLSEQLRLHQELLEKKLSEAEELQSTINANKKAAAKTQFTMSDQSPSTSKRAKNSKDSSGGSDLRGGAGNKKDVAFPQKLHEILSNPEHEDMISWMPHGKSWRILKPTAFENTVIPLHFRHSKYASFMRQVNGWGFQRVLHGNDHNCYKHELFVRDQPELCKKMKRIGTLKKVKEGSDNAAADTTRSEHSTGHVSSDCVPAGSDVTSIAAARTTLSNKLSSSIGSLGMAGALNQETNNTFGNLFQGTPAAIDRMGFGPLGNMSVEQMIKFSSSNLSTGTSPQQQQGSTGSTGTDGLEFLQQQVLEMNSALEDSPIAGESGGHSSDSQNKGSGEINSGVSEV